MSSISNLVFVKNLFNKDINNAKEKSPRTNLPRPSPSLPSLPSLPSPPSQLTRTTSRNKSVENFLKYQWSWTL